MQDARQKVFEITDSRGVEIAFEALGIPVTWRAGSNILHFARAMGSDPIIAIDVKDGR